MEIHLPRGEKDPASAYQRIHNVRLDFYVVPRSGFREEVRLGYQHDLAIDHPFADVQPVRYHWEVYFEIF